MTVYIESERLAGSSIRRSDGTLVVFVEPTDPPAGVREPARPAPAAPGTSAARRERYL